MPTGQILPIPGLIVNVDEIRLMHWIQYATTIRFAKDHGVQIRETPEHLMMSKTLLNK